MFVKIMSLLVYFITLLLIPIVTIAYITFGGGLIFHYPIAYRFYQRQVLVLLGPRSIIMASIPG